MSRSRVGPGLTGLVVALALSACGGSESSRTSAPSTTRTPRSTTTERPLSHDGATMPVEASGFTPGERINVYQCRSSTNPTACGLNSQERRADATGRVSGEFSPQQWIFTSDGWVDCLTEPCVLKVAANSDRVVRTAPVDLSGTTPAARPTPTMSVQPSGPYATGQTLTVSITGAPPGMAGSLTVCTKVPPGSAESGLCTTPIAGFFTTGSDGSATLVDYRLPAAACEAAASCELAWDPGYDYPPLVVQDVDYT
jgi:hypothetical protein